jgi:hypothetical protein
MMVVMPEPAPLSPAGRDRAVRRVRLLAWSVTAASAALAAGLSVVAAHAFKGHDGRAKAAAAAPRPRVAARAHVHVPRAQHVPAIAGAPAPLQPPAAAPTAAPPPPQQPPETSGGS